MIGTMWEFLSFLAATVFCCILCMHGGELMMHRHFVLQESFFYFCCLLMVGQIPLVKILIVYCRDVPKGPIGQKGKTSVDVITLCAALIVRHCFRYYVSYLMGLVSGTFVLYCDVKVVRRPTDIGFWDVLFGAVVQVLVCEMSNNTLESVAVVMLCGGFILYRYHYYSTPSNKLKTPPSCY